MGNLVKKLLKGIRRRWHGDIYSQIDEVKRQLVLSPPTAIKDGPELQKIYSALQDEESRVWFWGRLEYSMKGSMAGMYKAMMKLKFPSEEYKTVIDFLIENTIQKKKLYLYGLSGRFNYVLPRSILGLINLGIEISGVCLKNSDQEIEKQFNLPVISEDELLLVKNKPDAAVVVCNNGQDRDKLVENLLDSGFSRNQFFLLIRWYYWQYFGGDIMIPSSHEIFVDAGVLDLGSSRDFIQWCGGNYDHIYAFEPDITCFSECSRMLEAGNPFIKEKISFLNKGLSDKNIKLKFYQDPHGGAHITPNGGSEIETVALDEILNGKPVTFIKMDIEGSELAALKGAKNTIGKWKPRLAISIYHKPEDVIEIPLYILSLVPEYKMYIRHHMTFCDETVLHCVI
jgi:FkbM family methyltransferase